MGTCEHKNCKAESEILIWFKLKDKEYHKYLCSKCAKSVLMQGLANDIGFELLYYQKEGVL